MMRMQSLSILASCLIMSACSSMHGDQAGICQQLKHEIIFNGATNNDAKAVQERAALRNLNSDYRSQGC